jgi:mRNA interferase MazF
MYTKDFDGWNKAKQRLEKEGQEDLFFHEREVWWCSVGVNVGTEVDGKHENYERPILIIKKFNRQVLWGIPLSTKYKDHPLVIAVRHPKGVSYASISQIRIFSAKRLLRKLGNVDNRDFDEVCRVLKNTL